MTDTEAKYILDSEELFKIRVIDLLSLLIEHKQKKINAADYETFFIGYSKIVTLNTFYNKPILLVFECKDEIYFCEFGDDFITRPTQLINGGRVIHIDKSECGTGFAKLIERIREILFL